MFSKQIRHRYNCVKRTNPLFLKTHSAYFSSGSQKPLVTITGVEGFLGSQTALQFLKDGSFRVRGTIRNSTGSKELAPIEAAIGEDFEDLELVEAELLDENSVMRSIEGSTYVVHHASPYYFDNMTREEMVKPAVNGTLAVMRACTANNVKRIVATSSISAIANPSKEDAPKNGIFDESCWSNPDRPEGMADYTLSKTLAEKAAWDYQASQSNPFEIVMINPVLILGPSMAFGGGTSERLLECLLTNQQPIITPSGNGLVDVREVARAHLQAIKVPEARNKRFLMQAGELTKKGFAKLLEEKFGPKGFKIYPWDDQNGEVPKNSNAASREILGIEYRPLEKTIEDMVDSLIAAGKIQNQANV